MCGIAGFLRTSSTPSRDLHAKWLGNMADAIFHRGPDSGGEWIDNQIALAHRRLSIIDLSSAGHQPMTSLCERYVICFNGEIYNFQDLKTELVEAGYLFRSSTDTEVILAIYDYYGRAFVDRLNGMFAIAIWDRHTKKLTLARDRLGKKPLYYFNSAGRFGFASELKSIIALPFFKQRLRIDAIKDFFFYQYVPDPKTIYEHAFKLPPGHILVTDGVEVEISKYWDISFSHTECKSEEQTAVELQELIDDAVKIRMISDVPLGAFLSGGVDSSAIVALMDRHCEFPVTTCTVGFESEEFDEGKWSKIVSDLFGTNHYELKARIGIASDLQEIASFFDEPFADQSFLPTYYVSKLARSKVKVALSGDGGDENFAGYNKYSIDQKEAYFRNHFSPFVRNSVFKPISRIFSNLGPRPFRRIGSLLGAISESPDTAFFHTNSFFRTDLWNKLVVGRFAEESKEYDPGNLTRERYWEADTDDHLSRVLYTDLKTFLPGDILTKVDRMSMANSLETRSPLLDYRVVEYAASIRSDLKMKGNNKKIILKRAFENSLPEDILYRKKMGFSIPLSDWLRTEMRPIVEQLLFKLNSGISNIFDLDLVHKMWRSHLSGQNVYTNELWSIVAFELWWQCYMENSYVSGSTNFFKNEEKGGV